METLVWIINKTMIDCPATSITLDIITQTHNLNTY